MSQDNPYAAPLTDEGLLADPIQTSGGVWRDGKTLIMWKEAQLPDRCVRCNAPANGRRLRRTLYWHHPLVWLVVLAGVLVYIIVALIVRKKAVVSIGMCDRHYSQRLRSIGLWWLIFLGCIVSGWYGLAHNAVWFFVAAMFVFLGNLFFAVAITRPVAPVRIDDHYVWLKKLHPDYLAEFPLLPQQ